MLRFWWIRKIYPSDRLLHICKQVFFLMEWCKFCLFYHQQFCNIHYTLCYSTCHLSWNKEGAFLHQINNIMRFCAFVWFQKLIPSIQWLQGRFSFLWRYFLVPMHVFSHQGGTISYCASICTPITCVIWELQMKHKPILCSFFIPKNFHYINHKF